MYGFQNRAVPPHTVIAGLSQLRGNFILSEFIFPRKIHTLTSSDFQGVRWIYEGGYELNTPSYKT